MRTTRKQALQQAGREESQPPTREPGETSTSFSDRCWRRRSRVVVRALQKLGVQLSDAQLAVLKLNEVVRTTRLLDQLGLAILLLEDDYATSSLGKESFPFDSEPCPGPMRRRPRSV